MSVIAGAEKLPPALAQMFEDTFGLPAFEAYGATAGSSGTTHLAGVLRGKTGFVRRRPSSDTRACAAVALGKVSTPDARRVLEKALRERDPVVRNAAKRALGRDSA